MTDLNIGAGVAPAPPGDLRDVGPELRRYTVRALLDATASSIRLAFPGTLLLEAQVLAIQVKNWGWLIELTDDTADSTATAPRLRCLASKRTLIEIEEEIGQPLTPELLRGASAILKVRATFHAQHGFGLRLTGLDPAFGAGLVGKRIEQIRQNLISEGIYANQHFLPAPADVRTVAVIAPANSAARSDIAGELGRWECRGILTTLTWIDAHFEGAGGIRSLTDALVNACALARIKQADAVLLVRGGGDTAGLTALSNERVARALLAVPVPVIIGAGHARDQTLLDELAWHTSHTPSKALQALWNLIADPVLAASRSWDVVRRETIRAISSRHLPALEREAEQVAEAAVALWRAERAAMIGYRHLVDHRRGAVRAELDVLARELDRQAAALGLDALDWPGRELTALASLYRETATSAGSRLSDLDTIEHRQADMQNALIGMLGRQGQELTSMLESAEAGMQRVVSRSIADIAEAHAAVQLLNADDVLARGYVLAVTANGQLIKSAVEAVQAEMFSIVFTDGVVAVAPRISKTDATVH